MFLKEMGNMSSYLIPTINKEVYPQTRQRKTQVLSLSELKREKSKIKTNQNTQQRKKKAKTKNQKTLMV